MITCCDLGILPFGGLLLDEGADFSACGGRSAATDSRSLSKEALGETVGDAEGEATDDASENDVSPEPSLVESSSSELSLLSSSPWLFRRLLCFRGFGGCSEVLEVEGASSSVDAAEYGRVIFGANDTGVSGPVVEIDGMGIPS